MVRYGAYDEDADLPGRFEPLHQAVQRLLDHLAFERVGAVQAQFLEPFMRLGEGRIVPREYVRGEIAQQRRRAFDTGVQQDLLLVVSQFEN